MLASLVPTRQAGAVAAIGRSPPKTWPSRSRRLGAARAALGRGDAICRRARQDRCWCPNEAGGLGRVLVGMARGRMAVGARPACPMRCRKASIALDGVSDARRRDAAGARLGARLLCLHPLQAERERGFARLVWPQSCDRAAGRGGWPAASGSPAISSIRRPRIWGRRSSPAPPSSWRAQRRELPRHRRRRSAARELSDHPRRRPRQRPGAAARRSDLGRRSARRS